MIEHVAKHLFKHPDGRSPYYHCSYRDPSTKRWKVFSCRTESKEEASAYALARLLKIYDGAGSQQPAIVRSKQREVRHGLSSRCRISEFTDVYVENITTHRKRRLYTEKSKRVVRDSLNQLRKRCGDLKIAELTYEPCRLFIMTGQPSERTAQKHHINLKAAFRTAVEWSLRPDNPFDEFQPPLPEYDREKWEELTFTDELLAHLLKFIPEETFAQRRLRRLVIFAYET